MTTTPVRTRENTPLIPSPHYTAGRKYSLYGSEDRVVLDLGSKYWKYGFSGEATPRGVLDVSSLSCASECLWDMNCSTWSLARELEIQAVIQRGIRQIILRALMVDPKQRKIVVLENPLLPIRIKNMIVSVLFNDLQVC